MIRAMNGLKLGMAGKHSPLEVPEMNHALPTLDLNPMRPL